MNMKLVVCLFACALPLQGQKAPVPSMPHTVPARYQLLSLEFENEGPAGEPKTTSKRVFLLDSQTGQVWRYQASSAFTDNDKKLVEVPELFVPVKILQGARP